MTEEWMSWLADATLRGTVVIGVIWLLEVLWRDALGPSVRAGLWLVAGVVLLLPLRLELPAAAATSELLPGWASALQSANPGEADFVAGAATTSLPWLAILFAVWAAGAAVRLALIAVPVWRARAKWHRHRFCTDPALLEELEDARRRAGVWRPVGLVVDEDIPGPMVMGWLHARLLLPAWVATELNLEERRRVFRHELAHVRHHDLLVNWLEAACSVVHWFNPLVYLVARRGAAAREERADRAAIRWGGDDPSAYGQTLCALLRRTRVRVPLPAAAGMAESGRGLRARMRGLAATAATPLGRMAGVTLACGMLVFGAVAAPDNYVGAQGTKPAVTAMRGWLATVDEGKYAESWDEASKFFRAVLSQQQWVGALEGVRQPLGACESRELASAYVKKVSDNDAEDKIKELLEDDSKGELVVVAQFKTSFQNLNSAVETVSFLQASDGSWKMAGYYIKPNK
ncbi:MAG: M56 family metallopeptidase [Verrucomicrobiota bacterium]